MNKTNRVTVAFGAVVLAAVCVVGGISAMASGGDKEDPLVTLSYLTQVFTPEIMDQVDKQVAASEKDLTDRLDQAIEDYSEQMEQALGESGGESASFSVVTVPAGRAVMPAAGGEVLLRSGSASAVSGTDPILIDSTAGSTVSVNGALKADHLYVCPLDGAWIYCTSECTFLIRGSYTLA